MLLNVGIDDTDSPRGGCTTFIASVLSEILDRRGHVKFLDYPNLIRLNPNVPFKTRGNGAVALRLWVDDGLVEDVVELITKVVYDLSESSHGKSDPTIAFQVGEVGEGLKVLYRRALREVVTKTLAFKVAEREGVTLKFIKRGRGIVGAMAAIGGTPLDDYTFELIAYRDERERGPHRHVDPRSVMEMDRRLRPMVYANLDYGSGRILITPHGPDPVLYGIRGEHPLVLLRAMEMVEVKEPIARWTIFRTNQGTNAHLHGPCSNQLRPYDSVRVRGVVSSNPEIRRGGHVFFKLSFKGGEIACVAYKETGKLTRVARLLKEGDLVEVAGGMRPPSSTHGPSLNLEQLRLIKVEALRILRAPRCPKCGSSMKSMGRGKGYRCPKCGLKDPSLSRLEERLPPLLEPGLYMASPKAYRHLTKPEVRLGVPPKGEVTYLFKPWHYP